MEEDQQGPVRPGIGGVAARQEQLVGVIARLDRRLRTLAVALGEGWRGESQRDGRKRSKGERVFGQLQRFAPDKFHPFTLPVRSPLR